MGTTKIKQFTITLKVSDLCEMVDEVIVDFTTPDSTFQFPAHLISRKGTVDTWQLGLEIPPKELLNAEAGKWTTRITLKAADGDRDYAGPSVKILRASKLSINATPEPVRKGKTITIKGSLTRANWEAGTYRAYTKQKVALQYRTTKGSYATVKTLTTNSDGNVKTTVTATKDGCYRLVFAGTSTTRSKTTKGDCIDVR